MKAWEKWLILGLVTTILGGFYLFVHPVQVQALGLGFGLRHNDRVLVGALSFLLGIVSFYKMIFSLKWIK